MFYDQCGYTDTVIDVFDKHKRSISGILVTMLQLEHVI